MTVQPAFEIDLEHDGAVVTLRASLRAAVAIDNMPGGFPKVWEQIAQQSVTAIRAVILATATERQEAHTFLVAAARQPLSQSLPGAQAACLAVLACYFPDTAEVAESRASTAAERTTLRAYFQQLYGYATGWLGWTPAETWAASPVEIEAAFAAHTDRLVKLTPGLSAEGDDHPKGNPNEYTAERLREIEEQDFDPAFDREGLRALKAKHL